MSLGIGGIVSIGGGSSGSGGGGLSGIASINSDAGPNITLVGVSGVNILPVGGGVINIGVACFQANFTDITSETFIHNLDSTCVIIQVFNSNGVMIVPDEVAIDDSNSVSISFNKPQSGWVNIK